MTDILSHLEKTISQRMQHADGTTSYVASLHRQGAKKIAQKIGEEGLECALACSTANAEELVSESADLIFHLLVGLHHHGVSWDHVVQELSRREGISGIDEKNSRTSS